MRLGSLQLKSNLFLSPLAGYTNLPFRLRHPRDSAGLDSRHHRPGQRPLPPGTKSQGPQAGRKFAPQDTAPGRPAFRLRPGGNGAMPPRKSSNPSASASVDINMGCPVRKVCQRRRRFGHDDRIRQARPGPGVRGHGRRGQAFPSPAKMRLGWDDQNLTAPDLARAFWRTRAWPRFSSMAAPAEQGFGGAVNLAGIRRGRTCRPYTASPSSATAMSPRPQAARSDARFRRVAPA
jgi:tRNA-dihydrouridine synthase B